MMVDKAVPVVLRITGDETKILVFDHPLTGRQLVKGTVEAGETAEEAAVRELWEESGLIGVTQTIFLGSQTYEFIQQRWHFVRCVLHDDPPEAWDHFTQDGGGLIFSFCWQPIKKPIYNLNGPVFDQARRWILNFYKL